MNSATGATIADHAGEHPVTAHSSGEPAVLPRRAPRGRRTDWICAGRRCWRGGGAGSVATSRLLDILPRLTSRAAAQNWVRYRINLEDVPAPADDTRLTALTAGLIARLHRHPDHAQDAFASGLAFWDLGVRSGLVWLDGDEPLCFQYLLSDDDTAVLRARSAWANMYPPLDAGTAQLEKLWTFSTARKKGVASRFALAMFAEARRRGFRSLITHIHESNLPARSWAQRTGWQPYGSIVRYEFDVPLLHRLNLSVCAHHREGITTDGR